MFFVKPKVASPNERRAQLVCQWWKNPMFSFYKWKCKKSHFWQEANPNITWNYGKPEHIKEFFAPDVFNENHKVMLVVDTEAFIFKSAKNFNVSERTS